MGSSSRGNGPPQWRVGYTDITSQHDTDSCITMNRRRTQLGDMQCRRRADPRPDIQSITKQETQDLTGIVQTSRLGEG
jgi:hypothetical protein